MIGTSFVGVLFLALAGSGGDFLDAISTEAYWKAKGVAQVNSEFLLLQIAPPAAGDATALIKELSAGNFPQRDAAARKIAAMGPAALPALEKFTDDADPEVANRVRSLMSQIRLASKGHEVRRLMAIRTLGEQKRAEAVPELRKLLESKELFVADYARRALATIEGKVAARGVSDEARKAIANDLTLLPAKCGIAGQFDGGFWNVQPIDLMIERMPMPMGGNPQQKQQLVERLVKSAIELADQVGNIRLDGVTLGVSEDVGPQSGFVVVIARGLYDRQAIDALIGKQFAQELRAESLENQRVYRGSHDGMALFFPSNDAAVLLGGAKFEGLPLKEIVAAITTGQNPKGLATNAAMMKLIRSIAPEARVRAAAVIGENYRQAEVFRAFDEITLAATLKDKDIHIEMRGKGKDAQAVQAAVNQLNTELDKSRQHLPQIAQAMPQMKPLVDFVQSIKCTAEGTSASMTAKLNGDGNAWLAMPAMLFGDAVRPNDNAVPDVAPVERVQPEQPK